MLPKESLTSSIRILLPLVSIVTFTSSAYNMIELQSMPVFLKCGARPYKQSRRRAISIWVQHRDAALWVYKLHQFKKMLTVWLAHFRAPYSQSPLAGGTVL